MTVAEFLKYVCVYLHIDIHVRAHVFCRRNSGRFFPYLKHLFPSCTLPLLPLGITLSLMACLLQAILYDFWGRVSCTLPMFEAEAASTTSSLNNDSNHFQQTDNLFLAGYSLQPNSSASVTGSPDISSEPGTGLGCLVVF